MDFVKQRKIDSTIKLRELQKELPPFCAEFFRSIADQTQPLTKVNYARDLTIFFRFVTSELPEFAGRPVRDLTVSDLERLTVDDLEEFKEYLTYYIKYTEDGEREITNEQAGKMRKLSAIRTMFAYFFKKQKISRNITELIDMPKQHEKNIVRLEVNEVAALLDEIESGDRLTETQARFHKFTKKRDLALIMLLLGTGIRISECVGIDIEHVDFEQNAVKITRKGGNEALVYFNEEVRQALCDYLDEREQQDALDGHEAALFLSMHKTRLATRSIQVLVKKYSKLVTTIKKITPHKLRATFGTNLYKESRDIYLVADALGHKNIETTRKHYADLDNERRREAASYVKLRKE